MTKFFNKFFNKTLFLANIWSSDCNRIQIHNHLVHKLTSNNFSKLAIKLGGCGFESCRSHFKFNFRYGTCFKQGVHSGKL